MKINQYFKYFLLKIYNEHAVGFTIYQKEIFDQQMRMHIQLLTQNFMQCYGHPIHWKEAENCKNNLNELRPLIKSDVSSFNAKHVRECIKFCKRWEKELTENNRVNSKYIR